jgi:hypothetical protein
MGHTRLGNLPRTRKWQQVIDLIGGGADTGPIAAATLDASQKGLENASRDPALIRSFWLLTQLPRCATSPEFPQNLHTLGVEVSASPGLMEIVGAFSDSVDAHLRRVGGRTDLGEMGQMGAAETLVSLVGERSRSLFPTTPADVQRALGSFATNRQFAVLARQFFARLTERYLGYFLSRELPKHVGPDRRFENTDARSEFGKALSLHCRQASKIVEKFAEEWYSKRNWLGGISERQAAWFVGEALGKMRAELKKGAEGDGH